MPVPKALIDEIKRLIPPLDGTLHKGQSGRVGVLGGATDYTGAPYFSAISALRFGADLSHVICTPTAAGPIKSYSPDLIVHPLMSHDNVPHFLGELDSLLERLHVLVMGPGLGREEFTGLYFREALQRAKLKRMFIVLDADALWHICNRPPLIQGYRRALLTPNIVEFKRLCDSVGVPADVDEGQKAAMLSKALGGPTILQKGPKDIIAVDTTGEMDLPLEERIREVVEVDNKGGLKRCGGQGDILSGMAGTLLAWAQCYEDGVFGDKSLQTSRLPLLAALGASTVTRYASRCAFRQHGRSVVTEDMLPEIGRAFRDVFM